VPTVLKIKWSISLRFLEIFCLEGQTPCSPWTLREHRCFQPRHLLLLDSGLHFDVHYALSVQTLPATLKGKYLLKIKGRGMNVMPNVLFLHSSPRSITRDVPLHPFGKSTASVWGISKCPLHWASLQNILRCSFSFFSSLTIYSWISETVYAEGDLKHLEQLGNRERSKPNRQLLSPPWKHSTNPWSLHGIKLMCWLNRSPPLRSHSRSYRLFCSHKYVLQKCREKYLLFTLMVFHFWCCSKDQQSCCLL